jgi:RNA polymerase sigma-70 factor (ECF subfamily)
MAGVDAPQRDESWRRLIELLDPIHNRAAGTARRLAGSSSDGDDLFQDAVLRAYRALPSLRDESRFAPWFYTILLSVHRNRTRRSFWSRFLPLEAAPSDCEPAGDDGGDWEESRWRAARASRALATLSPEQREAVVLFEIEGFSIEEIAALQRVSHSAVKSRLARGRDRLRRIYERWGLGPQHAGGTRERKSGSYRAALAPIPQEEEGRGRASRA